MRTQPYSAIVGVSPAARCYNQTMSTPPGDSAFELIVVGAGAAGQLAAIAAAEQGRQVLLLERMPKAGMKLTASGGGRGNLTNLLPPAAIEAAFGRQGRFMGPALDVMGPKALRQLLDRLGVPTVVDPESRVYPASQRAADVQSALARRLEQLGVEVRFGCAATGLWLDDGSLRGVETSDGQRCGAERVILACGGRSWPKLGGADVGYALARQAGHTIVEPTPALVPLIAQQNWPARLAGVALREVRMWVALPKQSKAGVTGDVLLTHRGVSGPAVLDLSGTVAQLLAQGPVPLRIELVAGMDVSQWRQQVEDWRTASGRRQVAKLLQEKLPASVARVLCELAGVAEQTTAANLSAAAREKLTALLSGLELTVTATEGFETAFVTRGGVKLKEVDPATGQSRLLPGLFLAGELLDLDGPTGGFNLQWAFASGWLAGRGRPPE